MIGLRQVVETVPSLLYCEMGQAASTLPLLPCAACHDSTDWRLLTAKGDFARSRLCNQWLSELLQMESTLLALAH